jgi:hypothetical protein
MNDVLYTKALILPLTFCRLQLCKKPKDTCLMKGKDDIVVVERNERCEKR